MGVKIKKMLFGLFNVLSTIFGIYIMLNIFIDDFSLAGKIGFIFVGLPFISPIRKYIKPYIKIYIRVPVYIFIAVIGIYTVTNDPGFLSQTSNNSSQIETIDTETDEKNTVDKSEIDSNNDSTDIVDKNLDDGEKLQYPNSIMYLELCDAWKYAADNNIKINDYFQRKNVLKFADITDISQIINDSIYVSKIDTYGMFSKFKSYKYKKTLDETDYLYYGGLNRDNEPDGLGILFNKYSKITSDGLMIEYIGYFEDGEFSGYGVESEPIDVLGQDYSPVKVLSEAPLVYSLGSINEGHFEEGVLNGKVNYFQKVGESEQNLFSMTIGEYADDTWNGFIQDYNLNQLKYVGQTKDGEYHGKGKEYFYNTNQLKYEGEYKNGEYHGKGTLYDENGKIVHKGEFEYGDIK